MKAAGNAFIVLGIVLVAAGFVFATLEQAWYAPATENPYGFGVKEVLWIIENSYPALPMIAGGVLLIVVGGILGRRFQ